MTAGFTNADFVLCNDHCMAVFPLGEMKGEVVGLLTEHQMHDAHYVDPEAWPPRTNFFNIFTMVHSEGCFNIFSWT